jgi:hypothetical protein
MGSSGPLISRRTSLCAAVRAACGHANRLSCRFVIARLAALVPSPRVNLTRFHGVFAPNSRYRAHITPAGRVAAGDQPIYSSLGPSVAKP